MAFYTVVVQLMAKISSNGDKNGAVRFWANSAAQKWTKFSFYNLRFLKELVLPKENRLNLAREFRHLKRNGRSLATPFFTVLYRFSPQAPVKAGFIVSNKIGKAAVRSRNKRLLREVVQKHLADLPKGVEMVLIARPVKEVVSYDKLTFEFNKILPKIRS